MWPVVLPNSFSVVDSSFPSRSPSGDPLLPRDSPDSFVKDGRKIHVGDCALFKPPIESLPFIGIIRKLTADKEGNLSIRVNWLYRPSDVKLGKGVLLEAAPNEVFYSFHKDVIPAGSLLHPCKVAFLRKGAELPSGISSFVCRRVYDTENKCLWWLTDKDYVEVSVERQEEVDKLLNKTRLEMHGAVQSGGPSPKPLNGPTSTSQVKLSSDSVQNSGSLSSQIKGKKRDRSDQGSDPSKRERLHKAEHGDIGQGRNDHMLKSEIAKITDRGGLVDFGGVEKLVQLMQTNSADKRIDIAGRIMLADVISVTDRFDCLQRFVQLKGLSVLDEWLQEVHKGKIGDISNAKETEKVIEELLLALLRALDKLPVNLHALQTCNVGKSVNHLRTHKGVEISKKARSLVDTWKKRVEAEMNMNDMKSGQTRGVSWPSKPAASEGSQVGNRKSGPPVEAGLRSSITQSPASKGSQAKGGSGEGISKLSASGSIKPAAPPALGILNNPNHKMSVGAAASDQPLTPIKEERSSSSSQSQNNSQSCSGDQVKTAGNSYKEDARSSTTGSVSKSSSGASRHWKSSNGVHASAVSAAQRENASSKVVSSNRNSSSEKSSPTGVVAERLTEVPAIDHGTNQRLIVRLPNTGHSPSRVASVSSYEDPSVNGGKPSALKHDNKDRRVRARNELLQRSDVMTTTNSDTGLGKDGLGGTNDGNALVACSEQQKAIGDIVKPVEVSKATGSLLAAVERSGKAYDASLSSMNALVESCVKISEASTSTSPEDDGGMNLLASVAAGEIVKSDNASSSDSLQIHSPILEESCSVNDENKATTVGSEDIKEECCGSAINSLPVTKGTEVPAPGPKVEELTCDSSVVASSLKNEGHMEVEGANYSGSGWVESSSTPVSKLQVRSPVPKDDMKLEYGSAKPAESCTIALSEPVSHAKFDKDDGISLSEMDVPDKHDNDKKVGGCNNIEDKPSTIDSVDRKGVDDDQRTSLGKKCLAETKKEAAHDSKRGDHVAMDEAKVGLGSSVLDHNVACTELKSGRDEAPGPSPHLPSSLVSVQENETSTTSSRSKSEKNELDGSHELRTADAQPPFSIGGASSNVKLDFDLNEGFPADDGNPVAEPTKLATYGIFSAHPSYLVRPPISSSTSITWAAAAKGSFFPPENLLRGKGELGWKGSAATSAFRPAEPRKSLEMPVNTSEVLAVEPSKPGRRLLDFDLNVADERHLEDAASQSSAQASCSESGPRDRASGVLDLDLNRVDDNPDANPFPVNSTPRLDLSAMSNRPLSLPGGPSNGVSNSSRDFDLNNGPGLEEVGAEMVSRSQSVKGGFPFPSPAAVRVNGTELGNFSSWFPHMNPYSAITVPSILPGRGEQNFIAAAGSQRILAPPSSSTSFGLEMYRAPVLPSSPAVPFPSGTAFPYSGFPFDTSFPPSNSFSGASAVYGDSTTGGPHCFPTIPSQLVGPSSVVASSYTRPFMMSLPGVASSVGSDVRKWAGPIDLNSGPGGSDGERRDDRLPSSGRQHTASGSQSLTDEQLKAYQLGGGVAAAGLFKRKEPEGGWDAADRFSYKQASWQ